MKRPTAVLAIACLLLAAACTASQGAEPSTRRGTITPSPSLTAPPFDPQELIASAQRQMFRLDSYRVQTSDDYGYGFDTDRIIEFAAPDSHRETRGFELGGFSSTIETLYTAGSGYYRVCFDEAGEEECDLWWPEEVTPEEILIAAAGEYGHPWLIAALGRLGNVQIIEDDDPDTRDLIHLRGTVNPLAAQYDAESEVLGSWGTSPNGHPCYPPDTFAEDETCVEFDLEALQAAPKYRSYEALPLFLDVWFTPGSSNVKIYSIRISDPAVRTTTTWRYEYLAYDGIVINPADPGDIADPSDF